MPNVKWATFSMDGIGVEKDADKAFYWTQRAAEHGDRDGQFNLAYFYEEGIGTPVNMEKAKHWYKKLRSRTMILPSKNART